MDIYNFLLLNREILKIISTLFIVIICLLIVVRTNKLFKLSSHSGIRYFRNAFFFYGIAFILRYLGTFLSTFLFPYREIFSSICLLLFEYFIIMAGFFLFYSLLWKRFEINTRDYSSLFNPRIAIFYVMSFIIAILDYLWSTYALMYLSQIILFAIATFIIIFNNNLQKKENFLNIYSFVIALNLIMWTANFLIAYSFNWNHLGVIAIYGLNMIIFFLFLFEVWRFTEIRQYD